ncbi:hypothetical protein BJV82DRAFT_154377 [Fennellomyces sp. T-0311]|nr:hypothetical protein BJV82DRAFT_154377 [Fennellomyces sp. T-0311]
MTANIFPDKMSYPNHIFYGNGNWNGVQGSSYPTDKTIIFNIPVDNGGSITLASNQSSNGLSACKTIYNFYPVDSNGVYDADGTFTIYRQTCGELHGFVLVPRAHIRDGTTGASNGQVIGLDYAWSTGNGVAIKNYASTGCQYFNGCIPLIPNGDIDLDVSESFFEIISTEESESEESSTEKSST